MPSVPVDSAVFSKQFKATVIPHYIQEAPVIPLLVAHQKPIVFSYAFENKRTGRKYQYSVIVAIPQKNHSVVPTRVQKVRLMPIRSLTQYSVIPISSANLKNTLIS